MGHSPRKCWRSGLNHALLTEALAQAGGTREDRVIISNGVTPGSGKAVGPSESALGLFIKFPLEKYRTIGYVSVIQGF